MSISPARTAAFQVLMRVETQNAYSSSELPAAVAGVSDKDRSLCYEITLGTLRRQILLDHIISGFAKGRKLDAEVRVAVRMALYQLRFLDRVPPYSAVNDSVNLVQRAGKSSARAFVNALLRQEQREPARTEMRDELENISLQTSHPRWLLEKWISRFGKDDAFAIARANNDVPTAAFRVTPAGENDPSVAALDARPSAFVEGCYVADQFHAGLLELAESGKIYIQDEASQMAAHAVPLRDNARVLDVCASPGGKSTLIAAKAAKTGNSALVFAGDLHASRVQLLAENCRRQVGNAIPIIRYDATRPLPFADGSFEVVLVDAPCSGTGTIRHNPEIRYRVAEEEIAHLSAKQLAILSNASKLAAVQGDLIYSTCSLEYEENEEVCERFLALHPAFLKMQPAVPDGFLTDSGYARTYPQRDGMDGFFIAAFRRGVE